MGIIIRRSPRGVAGIVIDGRIIKTIERTAIGTCIFVRVSKDWRKAF